MSQRSHSTVVFDLGNVLVDWDPYLVFADRMSRDEWQEFAETADFPALNLLADGGTPLHEVVALATQKHPYHGELIGQYFDGFDRSLNGAIPGMVEIVEELLTGGVRLLGLTNWSAETFHHAAASAPVIERLEAVMVSGREGLAKPDPRIFAHLRDTFALSPAETVFVDDSPPNVHGAADLGFTAIRFTGATQLRDGLRKLDLLT